MRFRQKLLTYFRNYEAPKNREADGIPLESTCITVSLTWFKFGFEVLNQCVLPVLECYSSSKSRPLKVLVVIVIMVTFQFLNHCSQTSLAKYAVLLQFQTVIQEEPLACHKLLSSQLQVPFFLFLYGLP